MKIYFDNINIRYSETIDTINLLKLSPNTLRKAPTRLYIDILQQKTKKPVTAGVADPLVIKLLENEFPRRVSQVTFHKQIKILCRIVGINGLVSGFKNNPKTRRKEIVNAPKYEFVTSHIMRRSFASNYYGKIETPLLMNITGHSKESTFLTYIGTHQNKDTLADLCMQQAGLFGDNNFLRKKNLIRDFTFNSF
jgi:integrase